MLGGLATSVALVACTVTVSGRGAADPAAVDLSAFVPSAENRDPSVQIDGIQVREYSAIRHVGPQQRVAYTVAPPMGGSHDQAWAACNGVVYPEPVRSENLVHSLEHGAVWITYDPELLDADGIALLAARVQGQPYLVMSPFPGLGRPVSVQSWGHQLGVDGAEDGRIDQFVVALRQNQYTFPEPGASCAEVGGGYFDQDAPPPFVAVPQAGEVDGSSVVRE